MTDFTYSLDADGVATIVWSSGLFRQFVVIDYKTSLFETSDACAPSDDDLVSFCRARFG